MLKRRADFKQLVKEGKAPETPIRRGYQQRETTSTQTQAPARFGESTPIAR